MMLARKRIARSSQTGPIPMVETTGAAGCRPAAACCGCSRAVATLAAGGLTAACGIGRPDRRVPGTDGTIRIGYVTPATGALASFGAADRFVIGAMTQHFTQNPITVGGRTYAVEIVAPDSQSNVDRAADLADDLILNGDVQLMVVAGGAETATPISDQCEASGMPCIATGTPWQPWFFGRAGRPDAPFRWTYTFFWGLGQVEDRVRGHVGRGRHEQGLRRALARRLRRPGLG